MSQLRADTYNTARINATISVFDTVIEALLIALLVFMPLAFGAVEAWSELVVITLAGAMAICLALKLLVSRETKVAWTWAYVPAGLFVVLALFQLMPLPAGLVGLVSPNTAATKTMLLGDLPNTDALLRSMTLSFYPLASAHDLRLIFVVVTVFVVVVNVYRRPDQIKRLLAAISIIGAGIALLALTQVISGTDKIYWYIPTGQNLAHSGTFINHSHYSQFMNLSIGAALALLLVKLHESFREKQVTLPVILQRLTEPDLRIVWYLVGMIVVAAATIFLSLSRGGMLSLLIAGSFTALILTTKQSLKGRGWIMALMALCAFVCVLYLGFEAVYDRLATLGEQNQYKGRWQIVKDVGVAWTKFPVVGTGLGTHAVVYPMFDRSAIPALASHAENEYAQTAEETGLTGLVLAAMFAAVVWRSYARSVRSVRLPIRSAAFGLGFGLLAVMIHSFSDFGQHLPANACLSAVSCGLLVGLARMGGSRKDQKRASASVETIAASAKVRIPAVVLIAGIFIWAAIGAKNAYSAESYWREALRIENTLRENDWLGTNEDYTELLLHAENAVAYQPGSVKYRHWLNVYRWHAISRVTDPETGELVVTPQTLEFTEQIVDELHQARALCPTFGAAYCVAGQLERFVLNDPLGAQHIRTGFALAPCDPTACFVAGYLDAIEDKIDASYEKFEKAVQLDGRLFNDVADVYINHVDRPDMAVAIASDNVGWLTRVANALYKTDGHRDLSDQVRARVATLLREQCEQPNAPAWVLASMANVCGVEKDDKAAVDYYKRALALNYGQVYWRLALAKLLAKTGRVAEAIHEARVCLRLRPQMTAAKKLIEDLSVLPGAVPETNSSLR